MKKSSSKSFGYLFFGLFLILSFWPILNDSSINFLFLSISAVFLILTIFKAKILEEKFITQLKLANPEIILYDSENKILLNKLNMPKAMNFVDTNYAFSENFNGYVFYKKNNNKF